MCRPFASLEAGCLKVAARLKYPAVFQAVCLTTGLTIVRAAPHGDSIRPLSDREVPQASIEFAYCDLSSL